MRANGFARLLRTIERIKPVSKIQPKGQTRSGKRSAAKPMPNRENEPQKLYPKNFQIGHDLNETVLESAFNVQKVILNVLINKGRLEVVKVRHYTAQKKPVARDGTALPKTGSPSHLATRPKAGPTHLG